MPSWLITISIVQSMMMVIPVFAVAVNQHMTVLGNFRALFYSPTLRFIVLGGMMYTAASVQGSLQALRSVNTVTHFTHYTVAHAHLGLPGQINGLDTLTHEHHHAQPQPLHKDTPPHNIFMFP